MNFERIRIAAAVVLILGSIHLLSPEPVSAAESGSCYVCMPAVIQCPSYEEMNGMCIFNCGSNAEGGCAFYDQRCGMDEVYVPCYG